MSMTAVPISIRFVRAPHAASSGTASRAGGRSDGRGNRPRRRRVPRPRRRARSIAAAHRTPSASATAAIASNGRRRGSRCVSWRRMWCVFFGNRVGRGPDVAKRIPGELAVRPREPGLCCALSKLRLLTLRNWVHKWQSYIATTDVKDAKQPLCAAMVPRRVLRNRA